MVVLAFDPQHLNTKCPNTGFMIVFWNIDKFAKSLIFDVSNSKEH